MNQILDFLVNKIVKFELKQKTKKGATSANGQLEKNLSLLEPGKEGKKLLYDYYQKKWKDIILVSSGFLILLLFVIISQFINSPVTDGFYLLRNSYGQGNKNLEMTAQINDEKYPVTVEIEERVFSNAEAIEKINMLIKELPQLILGKNQSTDYITKPLQLKTSYSQYPFSIRWESDHYDILQSNGNLGERTPCADGETVTLWATITYQEMQEETEIKVIVYPPPLSEEEEKINEILRLIADKQKETSSDEYLQLPQTVNETSILWREKENGMIVLFLVLSIIGIICIWFLKDNELAKKCREREKRLGLEYSEFVSKLQLLIGCGMTIRGAVEKLGEDYKKTRREGGEKKYVYEELLLCIRKIQDGISETESYDYFGKRCSLLCYKKLSSLLIQNLRKGTAGLLYALSNETKLAFDERKQQAKRMGEEAQTKSLFPMILMLGIVMVIIMIPANMSFGGF